MVGYLLLALGVIISDQLIKNWVVTNVGLGETIFDNSLISLTHLRNEGAAWSILEGKMWFFYIVTAIVCFVVVFILFKYRNESKWFTIGLSLILGGAIGNFIDRLHLGYVVDMFQTEFMNFPIFNVADIALTVGVGCILIYIVLDERMDKVKK
ncbi:signal peptidase II [Vagococcus intermedius]|uniref:Lipoprotein signal peptidase n=1 Tax=Vagococcus intermedius TaxID=2991418 RepID=A0AAF0CTM7_9ENTE|nr:signal peptidase II [Vagococcus intermedius]WEG72627.1 signal peptidase II [Vagococcus intermedius]WEG74712.1 signal peptidase II [Vagococcus intermedius]